MPTRNINLTEHIDHFVEREVSSGRYSNASEIVREALRLLEEQEQEWEAKLQVLRQAAEQGFAKIDQGQGIVLKSKKALGQFFAVVEAEAPRNPPITVGEPHGSHHRSAGAKRHREHPGLDRAALRAANGQALQ
jgi:antitoxin ParD1/3/4